MSNDRDRLIRPATSRATAVARAIAAVVFYAMFGVLFLVSTILFVAVYPTYLTLAWATERFRDWRASPRGGRALDGCDLGEHECR